MSNLTKFVMALVGLIAMALVASRELFLFAAFQNPLGFPDSKAGRSHLWISLGAGLAASLAGVLMFYFFSLYQEKKWSKVAFNPIAPYPLNSPLLVPFNAKRWALAGPWFPEGQPDDRTPMDGSARNIGGTPSEQRSFTRRTHQLKFKKWSQDRHDER